MTGNQKKLSKGVIGGWLLHHDQKLLSARTVAFENIATAGRSARLLSAISKEDGWTVSTERVAELGNQLGIRKHELPGLLNVLGVEGLVQSDGDGVSVLGVTQARLLEYAANIFEGQQPAGLEYAAIDLAERGSSSPVRRTDCAEELAEDYKLTRVMLQDLFEQSEHIGFVDYEGRGEDRLYFNGSLFKRDHADKARRILDSLSDVEKQNLLEADDRLRKSGCLPAAVVQKVLGDILWSKLHQIGYFQVSIVANEYGSTEFVTKPEALTKYVPSGLADMLDDAKALSSSLTFGILASPASRGRIKSPEVLMDAFIGRGYVEGWASAIKRDYVALERKGVVQVTSSTDGHRLTLLKPEVGKMARELVLKGDASKIAAELIIGNRKTDFAGPETARTEERLKDIPQAKSAAAQSLNILRKR
ncbi:hypothetical protein HFO09_14045 [Rhizobium laguerreae]|uniref:hypothetical protein n=1 Tax=Rhizobium laguerreae TaxID=1076926 RepID=UPI001C91049E|nr:hypothetical protein [Rhizobium laguerreae]MBY3254529.1 hypothetical protein [Rhizobium laguerreae]MBY3283846.1 hypothetical protein [Rhizobium laguerreae]MBY3290188.1 hypothetical protein [Rhizobium laguerreae]